MTLSVADRLAVPEARRAELVDIGRRLRSARHVVLTTHVNADGDGAGSEAAVAAWLEAAGVDVRIVNPTPFPPHLRFLLHREDIVIDAREERAVQAIADADLVLVLDTSEANRVVPLDAQLDPARTIVLDHHPAGPTAVGAGVQDPTAAATGELVYDLITLSGDAWPPPSVLGAYVAIVSDTGSFRYANTTPRIHAITSELLARGIEPEKVFQRLFATVPPRRIHLLREALGRLEHDPEAGIAWIVVTHEVTDRLGSTPDDYEGLIDHARSIEGTQVALLFREAGPSETKLSLRSSGSADVNRVARSFGGGGHVKAAGATVKLPLAEAVPRVLEAVRTELARSGTPQLPA